MFFYIGKSSPLAALRQVDDHIFLDGGWDSTQIQNLKVWYKGYSTECSIRNNLIEITEGYTPQGKWCVITIDQFSKSKIYHPNIRGFPLFYKDESLTNLKLPEYLPQNNNLVSTPLTSHPISIDDAVNQILDILVNNIQGFYAHNSLETMNVLYSAGLDTLTVWALLDYLEIDYNLDIYVPKQEDITLTQSVNASEDYSSDLIDFVRKNYWGYKILRIYQNKNWNITGYYSERFQLREVDNAVKIANFLDKNIYEIFTPQDYLYMFINREDIKNRITNHKKIHFANEAELKNKLYNSINFDCQIWHIDNTFHFSPFFDHRITDTIMKLSLDDITLNGRQGLIQRKIIEKIRPEFLSLLSDYKNCGDIFSNFRKNWNKIKLKSAVKISVR